MLCTVWTFADDATKSSAPETTAAAPLASRQIQPSCKGSTSSVSSGISTINCILILPVSHKGGGNEDH